MSAAPQEPTREIPTRQIPTVQQQEPSMPPAAVPTRPASLGFLGMLAALLVTAVGALAVRDAVGLLGWTEDDPWLTGWLTGNAELRPHDWVAVAAVAAMLLGLWLLATALRGPRASGVRLGGGTGTWMGYADLERLCAATAESCDGVLTAQARAARHRVTIQVETTAAEVQGTVTRAVGDRLSVLASPPRVVVRTSAGGVGGSS